LARILDVDCFYRESRNARSLREQIRNSSECGGSGERGQKVIPRMVNFPANRIRISAKSALLPTWRISN